MSKDLNTAHPAIVEAAQDYIYGGYDADPARLARSLHPDLVKRIVRANPDGQPRLDTMSALGLLHLVESKQPAPDDQRAASIAVLTVDEDVATVRIQMQHWTDHLQLCHWNGRWLIVNALWRLHGYA